MKISKSTGQHSHCSEHNEQLLTRGVHEVKVDKVIYAQLLQLQYNRSQVGAKNLWVCVILEKT